MEDQSDERDGLFLAFCNLFLGLIFLSAFVANVLVLLVFYRKSGLRSIANRFVVNLMVINLVSCVSLLPLSLADNSLTSSDKVLCVATELSSVFCSSVTIYAVLLIALDQYFAVVDPLHYHRVISSSKSTLMIASSWCLSSVFTIWDGVQPSIDRGGYSVFRHCGLRSGNITDTSTSKTVYRYIFCTVYAVSVFVVPFVLICVIYYRICVAASGNTKRTRAGCMSTEESLHKEKMMEEPEYRPEAEKPGQLETSGLLQREPPAEQPSLILTRPSPPRSSGDDHASPSSPKSAETPFLKPTLKNNASFSRLSSLHIQFSSQTEEIGGEGRPRRHSNASPDPSPDPDFAPLSKARSPSIQSVPPGPARSSRSSSINSGSARHPASRASSIRSTSSYIVHNIRHRISNASLFRYREEARAARISALVIVMALVCWLPFFTVFYLHSGMQLEVVSGKRSFPVYLDSFSIAFLLLSAVVSPFLFAFRNRKIKKEIRKMMRCRERDCSKSFYRYNFSFEMKSHKGEIVLGSAAKKGVVGAEFRIDAIT